MVSLAKLVFFVFLLYEGGTFLAACAVVNPAQTKEVLLRLFLIFSFSVIGVALSVAFGWRKR